MNLICRKALHRLQALTLLRYLQSPDAVAVSEWRRVEVTATLSCTRCLTSSLDLIDPRISEGNTQSAVASCFHEAVPYAVDHWIDHFSAVTTLLKEARISLDDLQNLRISIGELTGRYYELYGVIDPKFRDRNLLEHDSLQEDQWQSMKLLPASRLLLRSVLSQREDSVRKDRRKSSASGT